MSRLAIFGGTFDPVHNAHVTVARSAADRVGLEQVLFIPAGTPPHKQGALAGFEHRYRMVELACEQDPRFSASRIEEGPAVSYSIHTIETVRRLWPAKQLHFIIGADAFAEIRSWFRWRDVAAIVTFIVVSRPGIALQDIPSEAHVARLENVDMDISSSGIRKMIQAGDLEIPVPAAVLQYIQEHSLYR